MLRNSQTYYRTKLHNKQNPISTSIEHATKRSADTTFPLDHNTTPSNMGHRVLSLDMFRFASFFSFHFSIHVVRVVLRQNTYHVGGIIVRAWFSGFGISAGSLQSQGRQTTCIYHADAVLLLQNDRLMQVCFLCGAVVGNFLCGNFQWGFVWFFFNVGWIEVGVGYEIELSNVKFAVINDMCYL